jgi:hypothetical protein
MGADPGDEGEEWGEVGDGSRPVERDVGCLEEGELGSEGMAAERRRLGTVRGIVLMHLAEALREAVAGGDPEAARVCHETLGWLLDHP